MVDTVVEALVGLGFTEKRRVTVVEAFMAESEDVETLETATVLRAALAALSGKK